MGEPALIEPPPAAPAQATAGPEGGDVRSGVDASRAGRASADDAWPRSSSECLPALPGRVAAGLVGGSGVEYAVNEECTSLTLAPSGRHVVAGFTDGTIRLFDLTGRLRPPLGDDSSDEEDFFDQDSDEDGQRSESATTEEEMRQLFDYSDNSDADADEVGRAAGGGGSRPSSASSARGGAQDRASPGGTILRGSGRMVCSKANQQFGAVAAQIHAKGVITSLLLDVSVAEDGLYAFGGVLRGSMEMVAVDLGKVEAYHDALSALTGGRENRVPADREPGDEDDDRVDILDLITVHRHSDAKLKGFGACTRLRKSGGGAEYRLFTGKGIKNMHIWSFVPPTAKQPEPQWQCLYDTPTNGNTIRYLHFRYDPTGLLQGISKSDDQKLRVWDLSCEQGAIGKEEESMIKQLKKAKAKQALKNEGRRPKRPPFVDIAETESTLGVFGPYAFAGGAGMYNQMSVINLDVEDVMSPYNHTELALPGIGSETLDPFGGGGRRSRSGRQQRGELKSVISVAGLESDAGHVLLELSDRSLVHYTEQGGAQSRLEALREHHYKSSQESRVSIMDGDADPDPSSSRRMCITRIGAEGVAVLTSSTFNANSGRGTIMLSRLLDSGGKAPNGFWGFHGASSLRLPLAELLPPKPKMTASEAPATISMQTPKLKRKGQSSTSSTAKGKASSAARVARSIVTPSSRTIKNKKDTPRPVALGGQLWDESSIVGFVSPNKGNQPIKDERVKAIKTSTKKDKKKEATEQSKARMNSPKQSAKHSRKTFQSPRKGTAAATKPRSATKVPAKPTAKPVVKVKASPRAAPKTSPKPSPKPAARKNPRARSPAASTNIETLRWRNSAAAAASAATSGGPSSFRHRHKRPRLRDLPTAPVARRIDLGADPSPSTADQDGALLQEHERRRLAAEHRAWHEMVRRRLVGCAERQIALWNTDNVRSRGARPTYEKVEKWVDSAISSHQDVLADMLDRQRMEASALAAAQTAANGGRRAPLLRISFPFPKLFDEVRDEVLGHFPAGAARAAASKEVSRLLS